VAPCDAQTLGMTSSNYGINFNYVPEYILPHKVVGNFSTSPSTCPISPLVTARAHAPVFCPLQLRSVTSEQRLTDKGARSEPCNKNAMFNSINILHMEFGLRSAPCGSTTCALLA